MPGCLIYFPLMTSYSDRENISFIPRRGQNLLIAYLLSFCSLCLVLYLSWEVLWEIIQGDLFISFLLSHHPPPDHISSIPPETTALINGGFPKSFTKAFWNELAHCFRTLWHVRIETMLEEKHQNQQASIADILQQRWLVAILYKQHWHCMKKKLISYRLQSPPIFSWAEGKLNICRQLHDLLILSDHWRS